MVAEIAVTSKAPKVRNASFRRDKASASTLPRSASNLKPALQSKYASGTPRDTKRSPSSSPVGEKSRSRRVIVRGDSSNNIRATPPAQGLTPRLHSDPQDLSEKDSDVLLTRFTSFDQEGSSSPREAPPERRVSLHVGDYGSYMQRISQCPDRRPSLLCRRSSLAVEVDSIESRQLTFQPTDTVKACIRLRAPCGDEQVDAHSVSSYENGETSRVIIRNERMFDFDKVVDDTTSIAGPTTEVERRIAREDAQGKMFSTVGVQAVENIFSGFNCCLMAYGQTGSGKTYTMVGPVAQCTGSQSEGVTLRAERGLIPRICEAIFKRIEVESAAVAGNDAIAKTFKLEIRHMEIYKEKARDLLVEETSKKAGGGQLEKLRVRLHPVTGPFVQGLSVREVNGLDDCRKAIEMGVRTRALAATNTNELSSRSHVVFRLTLTQSITVRGHLTTRVANLNLVDLAGSERFTSVANSGAMQMDANAALSEDSSVRARQSEALTINQSLSTLRRVIDALTAGKKVVPYRDSILTWVLSDTLGGNSKTIMLGTISPTAGHAEESLRTLVYMSKARKIINTIAKNEDTTRQVITDLRTALLDLQLEKHITDKANTLKVSGLQEEIELAETALHDLESQTESAEQKLHSEIASLRETVAKRETQNQQLQLDMKKFAREARDQDVVDKEREDLVTKYREIKEKFNAKDAEAILLKQRNIELSRRFTDYQRDMQHFKRQSHEALTHDTSSLPDYDIRGLLKEIEELEHGGQRETTILKRYKALQKSYRMLKSLQDMGRIHNYDQEAQTDHWIRRAQKSEGELEKTALENAVLKAKLSRVEEELESSRSAHALEKREKWTDSDLHNELLEEEFKVSVLKKKVAALENRVAEEAKSAADTILSHSSDTTALQKKTDELRIKTQRLISNLHKHAVEASNALRSKPPCVEKASTSLEKLMHATVEKAPLAPLFGAYARQNDSDEEDED